MGFSGALAVTALDQAIKKNKKKEEK